MSLRDGLKQSACARLPTVLGPGSDGYHEQHIHFDIAVAPRRLPDLPLAAARQAGRGGACRNSAAALAARSRPPGRARTRSSSCDLPLPACEEATERRSVSFACSGEGDSASHSFHPLECYALLPLTRRLRRRRYSPRAGEVAPRATTRGSIGTNHASPGYPPAASRWRARVLRRAAGRRFAGRPAVPPR